MRHLTFHLYLTFLLTFSATPVWAYLDPASSGMFIQMLVGGVAGVAVVVKLYWHKVLTFLGMGTKEDEPPV